MREQEQIKKYDHSSIEEKWPSSASASAESSADKKASEGQAEKYNHAHIEKKWQEKWKQWDLYKTDEDSKKENRYILDMFPYPSGAGLHVGHPKGYIATDVTSRFLMLKGFNVLHPMGWDAFGLPAENYAIKNKIHPRIAVKENIATFKEQLERFGFTYDWSREINTTDPEFYKWTQWTFLKMFEKGLAFESEEPVNWCPNCKTVLANEDLENGLCERCGTQVLQRKMRQWVLKMTEYAERLLDDLEDENINWEKSIKDQQKNWIGKSVGTEFDIAVKDSKEVIKVFTTRIDTVFGMTYVVVSPENELVEKLKPMTKNLKEVNDYVDQAARKTELERTDLAKEKTGVKLEGVLAINPFNEEEIPIFVADYVLSNYGTGAVMAVPAHDERDWEFAKKYDLPVKQSIAPYGLDEKNPPHEGKENTVRKVVHVILENDKGEVLTLQLKDEKWGEEKPRTLIIGGIEDGETLESAALREIKEETGYSDVEIVKVHPIEFHAEFFAAHKDLNRYVKTTGVFCKLKSEKRESISAEEEELHDLVWTKREMLSGAVTIQDDMFLIKAYLENLDTYTGYGILVNSGEYNGLASKQAKEKMNQWLEENNLGGSKVNYKMRDWVFSRQRYWGEPIPIIHCDKCGTVAVPEEDLPVKLPEVENYEPTGTGEGPLAKITDWVNTTCPKCGGPGKRETNTMPQWAGSSWYFLRYIDPNNNRKLIDKNKEEKWMPVDLYVGGAEHATRHLLYARFWHKFLYDIGVVSTKEPFGEFIHVGLINAEDGRKMSKRWNNVINPDDIIDEFGADAIRVYEMFMGPFIQNISWSTEGVVGARRFLEKVNKLANSELIKADTGANKKLESLIHKTIKKVTEDIEAFKFNTAISSLMILTNEFEKQKELLIADYQLLVTLLSPFAPHLAEELWHRTQIDADEEKYESIFLQSWPEYDPDLAKDDEIELIVQINGKLRDKIKVAADISKGDAKRRALESEKIKESVKGKEIIKTIFVKGRLISLVVK